MDYYVVHRKAEIPHDSIGIDTCHANGQNIAGDFSRWAWANPTNTRFPVTYADVTAVSVEALWQGTKIRKNMQVPDPDTLAGDWRRAKGRKPLGHWSGEHGLLLGLTMARLKIYLPAYINQIHNFLQVEERAKRSLLNAEQGIKQGFKIALRDFDTGEGVANNSPMSHAWVLATILNGTFEKEFEGLSELSMERCFWIHRQRRAE